MQGYGFGRGEFETSSTLKKNSYRFWLKTHLVAQGNAKPILSSIKYDL